MSTDPDRLRPFFNPRSVAVIGASEQGMYPAGIMQNLINHGFPRPIYPINPRRESVFGLKAYPDVTQTPEPPDLAVFTLPREGVLPALRQCAQVGVKAACLISAGFAESGSEGRQMQQEMVRLVHESGMALIGPNCAGIANVPGKLVATRLPSPPRAGRISFTSQSGALMMALYDVFADRRAGMNLLVSTGNQADVSLADTLVYMAQDDSTGVVATFLEGFEDGQRLVEGARRLLAAEKPLVLLKSGRTHQGQMAAATHTGALAGSDRVFTAVCRQFGILLVDDIHALVDTTCLWAAFGEHLGAGLRAALVTQSGGLGSFTADLCEQNGIWLPPLSRSIADQLRALPDILAFSDLGNPADVRGAAVLGRKAARTLAPFMEDPAYDVVILLLARALTRAEDFETAQALVELAHNSSKPLAVVWAGGRKPAPAADTADRILLEGGIPVFEQPSDCIQALGRLSRYAAFQRAWLDDPENCYA